MRRRISFIAVMAAYFVATTGVPAHADERHHHDKPWFDGLKVQEHGEQRDVTIEPRYPGSDEYRIRDGNGHVVGTIEPRYPGSDEFRLRGEHGKDFGTITRER